MLVLGILFLSFVFADVYINEVESNPVNESEEYVELFNSGLFDVNISGWSITDSRGRVDIIPNGTIISAEGFFVFEETISKLDLKNNDSLMLNDSGGALIDQSPFLEDSEDDESTWQRTPDGVDNFTFQLRTKGVTNNFLTSLFDLTIHSPIDGVIYDSRRVLFNISSSENLSFIKYIDWSRKRPRWKTLCSDCNEYGFSREKTKSFKDGENNISIRASDELGFVKEYNVSFLVDSEKPRIFRVLPRRKSVVNGSEFYIKYTESNLMSVELFWTGPSKNGSKVLSCSSGRNQECVTEADLSENHGEMIEYWFVVNDSINSVKSKKIIVEADTVKPVLNNPDSFWAQGIGKKLRYVYFDFNVTEENFDKISYIDYSLGDRARWRRLCSRLKDGICEKRKSFRRGSHSVGIMISDDAGNSILTEPFYFEVL